MADPPANAFITAAAPALYSAAKDALSFLETLGRENRALEDRAPWVFRQLRHAIARAEAGRVVR